MTKDATDATTGIARPSGPLAATWLGVAVVLGLLLAHARAMEGPLDDTDPARQRPGFLDAGALPAPAPPVLRDVPSPGRPAVVFFVRDDGMDELCRALGEGRLAGRAVLAVVVGGAPSGGCGAAAAVVADPEGERAEAYGMRLPRDGGPPVGYAVVDARGDIRYRTLDPAVAERLDEVTTMVAALP